MITDPIDYLTGGMAKPVAELRRIPCSQCGGEFPQVPGKLGYSACQDHQPLEMIKLLAARNGATDAVIEACRVLRARRMDDAADALINSLARIQTFAQEGA